MAIFSKKLFEDTLEIEGRYSARRSDRGNYVTAAGGWAKGVFPFYDPDGGELYFVGSNWGISAPVLSDRLGRRATEQDMKNLQSAVAADIYEKEYFDRNRLGYVESQPLATLLFDSFVNQGNWTAFELQRTLKQDFGKNIDVDGKIGSMTIAAVNSVDAAKLHNNFKRRRAERYRQTAQNDPAQAENSNGWSNRLNKFRDLPERSNSYDDILSTDDEPPSQIVTTISIAADEIGETVNDWFVRNTPVENKPGRNNVLYAKIITALVFGCVAVGLIFFYKWVIE